MNAEQTQHQLPSGNAGPLEDFLDGSPALSALADGEIGSRELDALIANFDSDSEALSNWHAYQVIGDVLRGQIETGASIPPNEFLAAVRVGLKSQDTKPLETALQAAEVFAVQMPRVDREAANDSVFRWKLVASFASVAAVMAVGWNVLVGSGAALNGAAGPQIALSSPTPAVAPIPQPATGVPSVVSSSSAPVAVNTGQGVLIRDAQLEALLAEHRQHGGMSALQSPSGFIRSATYDAAGR